MYHNHTKYVLFVRVQGAAECTPTVPFAFALSTDDENSLLSWLSLPQLLTLIIEEAFIKYTVP